MNTKQKKMSEFNALKICSKFREIQKIKLNEINEKSIKKSIKGFSILPAILEKIVIDYESELTMIAELKPGNKKEENGFYYKGFYINSSAIVAKVSFPKSTSKFVYTEIGDLDYSKIYLHDKIVFKKSEASALQRRQIDIVEAVCECGINPFGLISFYDKKYVLRTAKMIDIFDTMIQQNINGVDEILKSLARTLKAISNNNLSNKHIMCLNTIQKVLNSIVFT